MIALKKIILMSLILISFLSMKAQVNKGDAILGQYFDEAKYTKIKIYKSNNKYFGKLIWGKDMLDKAGKPNKDVENPDPEKKKRNLYNLIMLTNFVYKDGAWVDGKVYNASNGKTFNATMKLNDGKLIIRNFIGIPLFGRNTTWERVK